MRVLHVITRMILGGAQENTLLTCEGLHARGARVVLLTGPALGPEGELMGRARAGGYTVEVIDSLRRSVHPIRDAQAAAALLAAMRRHRPDVVHTHSSKAGILGRWAARQAGVPAIVHTIHGLAFGSTASAWENAVYVPLERLAARWTDRIISVADAMTRQALAAGVGRKNQYITIYSGMETEGFLRARESREEVRRELGLGPSDITVGKVARMFRRKGFEEVIEAARRLCPVRPELRFVLVGDGELRAGLERTVREHGLADRVIFTGLAAPQRIPGLMGAFDVLVHASRREGLPRVVPQALLAGTPVVCCNVDGAPEVVTPGETGLLYEPGDLSGLTAALDRLVADAGLRRRLADAGRRHCLERFDHRVMTERIAGVYRDLLARGEVVRRRGR